jgi:hypothetical protein
VGGGGCAQISQNYSSQLNILGARSLTGSKLHTEDLQTFGDTVRSSGTTAQYCPGYLSSCPHSTVTKTGVCRPATFINTSQYKTSWKSAHWLLNCHTHIVKGDTWIVPREPQGWERTLRKFHRNNKAVFPKVFFARGHLAAAIKQPRFLPSLLTWIYSDRMIGINN